MGDPIDVYIHVPFCLSRNSATKADVRTAPQHTRRAYLEALRREAASARSLFEGRELASVYIGGGAGLMQSDELARIVLDVMRAANRMPGAEVTVRFPPQTVGTPSLSGFNTCSFNRACIEALCYAPKDFAALGADFGYDEVEEAMNALSVFRCSNCDVELLYGLPGQTRKGLENELCVYTNFRFVSHVTLEPYRGTGAADDDERADLFDWAVEYLASRGFELYGAQRFAKPGKQCVFFTGQSRGRDCVGLGSGAKTSVGSYCYQNTSEVERYIEHADDFEAIVENPLCIEGEAASQKRVALGMQLVEGFDANDIPDGRVIVEPLVREGLAVVEGTMVRPTRRALREPDQVRAALAR